jgi:hypothetical protein
MVNLEGLWVEGTDITEQGRKHLGRLVRLRTPSLANTRLTHHGPQAIRRL